MKVKIREEEELKAEEGTGEKEQEKDQEEEEEEEAGEDDSMEWDLRNTDSVFSELSELSQDYVQSVDHGANVRGTCRFSPKFISNLLQVKKFASKNYKIHEKLYINCWLGVLSIFGEVLLSYFCHFSLHIFMLDPISLCVVKQLMCAFSCH